MTCKQLERLLSNATLADLTPEQRQAVAVHAERCDKCRDKWGFDRRSQVFHAKAQALRPKRDLTNNVMARIAKEEAKPQPKPRAANGQPKRQTARPAKGANNRPPQRLGDFEILELIGRGGMGAVYKARQASLGRLAAVKVLPRALSADTTFVARFQREARAAAAVRHPNIVRVYFVGEEGGRHYIAMELVDGQGLSAVIRREGLLPQGRAFEILKQTTAALAAAHDAGIVHRDIKPSNILLRPDGTVKLADFGLARRLDLDVSVTAAGTALGTPLYMPPEAGRGQAYGERADLYSLGATFYHVLAGRPPFQGNNATELIVKHATASASPLGASAPGVDPRLARIIHRLLRKDPADRHASACELLGELEALGALETPSEVARAEGRALIADAPTLTMGPGRRLARQAALEAHKRRKATRRNTAVVAAAVSAGLLLVAVGVAAWARWGPGRERPQAVSPGPPPARRGPPPARKGPPKVDPRSQAAENLFNEARAKLALGELQTVAALVDLLEQKYRDTPFYRSHLEAIRALRSNARRGEPPPTPPPVPEAPFGIPDKPGVVGALFDGQSLRGWAVAEEGRFARHGDVRVGGRCVTLATREGSFTGIRWASGFPKEDYEISLHAQQLASPRDLQLVLPVGDEHCVLHAPGFGGGQVGLSYVDGRWGNSNMTTTWFRVPLDKWYRLRARVSTTKIEAWIDEDKVIDVMREGHIFQIVTDRVALEPFGIHVIGGKAVVANVRVERVNGPADEPVSLPEPDAEGWMTLADGTSLDGWRIAEGTKFVGHGDVVAAGGRIVLGAGIQATGIAWAGDVPRVHYEIEVDAARVAGAGTFASLVFPLRHTYCRLVVGGATGDVVALSFVDGRNHNDPRNPTRMRMSFELGRHYRVRLRVTDGHIRAWIDDRQVIDFETAGHKFGDWHFGIRPLGVCAWRTKAAIRSIRLRRVEPDPAPDLPFGVPDQPGGWGLLFDRRTLRGWRPVERFTVDGQAKAGGQAAVEGGRLVIDMGAPFTGLVWTEEFPKRNYEVRVAVTLLSRPNDFGITFPVGESACVLRAPGAYGNTVGLDLLDGKPGRENTTKRPLNFPVRLSYEVRLRVTDTRVQAWADDDQVIDVPTEDHTFELPESRQPTAPFGLSAWGAKVAVRDVRIRLLEPVPEAPEAP